MDKSLNVNEQIEASRVNLVKPDGTLQENTPLKKALQLAEEEGLDIVEVSVTKDGVSICKLMDYGKLVYEKGKQSKKNRKSHKQTKEIRYGYNIDSHDLDVKHNKIFKFLDKGCAVRYVLELKGREKSLVAEAKLKMANNLESFRSVAQWKDPSVAYGGGRITISTTLNKI